MTNGHWGVCRSAPPIPEPGEPRNRYLGAGGADFDKGDFVTGFPYPRSAERPRRGRSEPLRDVLPCASSFAIETGSREHKPTGTVVSKCALLYRSGVPALQVLHLTLTNEAPEGASRPVRRGPRGALPHPDKKTPSGGLTGEGQKGVACLSLCNY